MKPRARVLVVDDDQAMAEMLADPLRDEGYEVTICVGGAQAVEVLAGTPPDLVVSDLRMNDVDGFDVLAAARRCEPAVPVFIMTAFGAVESAVEAIKRGAAHYFTKPFALAEVLVFVRRALEQADLRAENRALRSLSGGATSLVGRSRALRSLEAHMQRVAESPLPVLVRGESGTGKELVARGIHELGARRSRPFVAVNCSAVPATLLESELFGHVKGSFTGATGARRGLFAEADGGSLFLDEIGDMAIELQARLLRVLQDGMVRPVGADQQRATDVRIIAATHQDLEARIKTGLFRADLYYRLNVVRLEVPPLRERAEDIAPLAAHFLERARARSPHLRAKGFSTAALTVLERFPWPGNVRELESTVERLCLHADDEVISEASVRAELPQVPGSSVINQGLASRWTLRRLEDEYITAVLADCGGNKTKAAELLGIDVSTLHRRERARQGEAPD
ncbi:MAG: sigma-54 dependent transcriptional regulator [Archangium sp.]|nr:sigma-54 dependent transcriptional regulator [Archangium sp.]